MIMPPVMLTSTPSVAAGVHQDAIVAGTDLARGDIDRDQSRAARA